jgi:CheY-like chemotaxis protein
MKCVPKQSGQHKETVLIVEDEPDDLRFAQSVIAATCPELCTKCVTSGEQMISYLKGENQYSHRDDFPYPMLILLDLRLPGIHGFDVLRWLQKNPPHNALPVIVLTVSGEAQSAQYSYYLGARSFLTKPLNGSEFKEMMAKLQDWCKPKPLLSEYR